MKNIIILLSLLFLLASCGSPAKQSEPTATASPTPSPTPTNTVNIPSPNINDNSKIPPAIPRI